MTEVHPSTVLASLFEDCDPEQRLTVLHVGPALSDTIEFFSNYRCRLVYCDLFAELPIELAEDDPELTLTPRITDLLGIPPDCRFDVCLFWDIFNYLSEDAIRTLQTVLKPHLHGGTRAHCFAIYNRNSPRQDKVFGIHSLGELSLRDRPVPLPAYAPPAQSRLKDLLSSFTIERSVLLAGSRLEMLMRARA